MRTHRMGTFKPGIILPLVWMSLWLCSLPGGAQTPAPATVHLTLNDALERALLNSPDLGVLRSRVAQNGYQIEEILSAGKPTLQFVPSFTRIEPPVAINFGGNATQIVAENNYNLALTLNQTIATFGRLHWRSQAARLAVKEQEQEYRRQAEVLIDAVTSAYVNLLLEEDSVSIAERNLQVQEAHLKDAEALYKAGVTARFDVLRNETQVSDARQKLIATQNDRDRARIALLSAMGDPTNETVVLDPLPPPPPPPADRDAGLRQAYARRPELESVDFGIASAEALVYWQQSQLNPIISMTSNYAVKNVVGFAATPNQWTTSLQLAVPILDGGLTAALVGEAKEALEQLRQQRETIRRSVELDVQGAFLDLSSAWERRKATLQQVTQAEEALRVAEVRYRNGVGTNLERLDASAELTTARLNDSQALYSYLSTYSHWRKAISEPYPVLVPGLSMYGKILQDLENYRTVNPLKGLPPTPKEPALPQTESGTPQVLPPAHGEAH